MRTFGICVRLSSSAGRSEVMSCSFKITLPSDIAKVHLGLKSAMPKDPFGLAAAITMLLAKSILESVSQSVTVCC